MRLGRSAGMIAGAAVFVVLGVAGAAWACSPLPRVYSVVPESAAPGETVLVRGQVPSAVVEIRWNGVGVSSWGVALLGVGLVGLFAGSSVAVARSRRAPATPGS